MCKFFSQKQHFSKKGKPLGPSFPIVKMSLRAQPTTRMPQTEFKKDFKINMLISEVVILITLNLRTNIYYMTYLLYFDGSKYSPLRIF